jgi:hypothetical protein
MIDLKSRIDIHINSLRKNFPCRTNRASAIGDICLRALVYSRVAWDKGRLPSLELQKIFEEGKEQEKIFLRLISDIGLTVIEQQIAFEDRTTEITAHLDGVLLDPEDNGRVPFEFKSCSPFIFDRLNKYDPATEYFKAIAELGKDYPHLLKYPPQISLYCYFKGAKYGLAIFKNKSTGNIIIFTVLLDIDYVDGIFKKAQAINGYVEKFEAITGGADDADLFAKASQTLPERITDRDYCADCRFNGLCLPEINFNDPLKIEDDPEFESKIDEFFLLKESADRYKEMNEKIISSCRGRNNIIVGKYLIEGKPNKAGNWLKTITFLRPEDRMALFLNQGEGRE